MGLNLRVASNLEVLAEALAAELSVPLEDPFLTEVLAVPGDGVRSWLMDQLSRRLGATDQDHVFAPDGIAANIEVVFPATVVKRALAGDTDLHEVMSAWSVGPLTWAIHDLFQSDGAKIGIEGDLQRARSLADQFDRYGMHRVEMVRSWESGRDLDPLGRPLPEGFRWQPQLWRALLQRLGPLSGPGAMAEATNRLRLGRIAPALPPRVFIFGLTSIPIPHLRVLLALSTQIEVEMFVPTWSLKVWREVRDLACASRLVWPIERNSDPVAQVTQHPFGSQWGRTSRDAQLLLAAALAEEPGARISEIDESSLMPRFSVGQSSLLLRIQTDLRSDITPPGSIGQDPRSLSPMIFDPADRSMTWHRCHGPTRQAEVLRDLVRGLLEECDDRGLPQFEPRDIAVLCADPAVSAQLISAAFGSDAAGSEIPIRLADRSLRQESSLFEAVSALLDLCEGRFRASDLLAFAALEPVRTRFGWESADLGRIAGWIEDTGVRWGLEEYHQTAHGLPAGLGVHTWRAGLDQLLLGAVMGDRALFGQGSDSPLADLAHPGIEGDLVGLVGGLAEMVDHLVHFDGVLAAVRTPSEWGEILADVVRKICLLPDDQAWQWQSFDAQITALLADARVGVDPVTAEVSADEMADLFRARLVGSPGRVRFGTGAVTVSSLTAQRGVPHRVVVIHGLDGDHGAGTGRADDLIAAQPCVGDRDPRTELRAQLLDAVLAASERLIIINTGRNITSNEEVPDAVPLAELADLIDATAILADREAGPVSARIALQHPRHGWGSRNFQPGAMVAEGAWGFQVADLEAAVMRSERGEAAGSPAGSVARWADLPAEQTVETLPVIHLADLKRTLGNPLETYLSERLGIVLPRSGEEIKDLISLSTSALGKWRLRWMLLEERLQVGTTWSDEELTRWSQRQRRRGTVPPLLFGSSAIEEASEDVEALIAAAFTDSGSDLGIPPEQRDVRLDVDGVQIHGTISNIRGSRIVEIYPGAVKAKHLLDGWIRLMVLSCAEPLVSWNLTLVGLDPNSSKSKSKSRADSVSLTCHDPATARRALATVVELHRIALQTPVVAPSATTMAFATGGVVEAGKAWEGFSEHSSDRNDRWVRYAFGRLDFGDLMDRPPTEFERGPDWIDAGSQIECWAVRIWKTVAESLEIPEPPDGETAEPLDGEAVEPPDGAKESWIMKWVRKILLAIVATDSSQPDHEGASGE